MQPPRSLTSSQAKASLGELLTTLATNGPVDITRNGRQVAVLSASGHRQSALERSRVAELAELYAAGRITWKEIAAETGVAFGDLLDALAKQNLRLPRVTPAKSPEQVALLDAATGGKVVKPFYLVVTDSAPLITLGVAKALDALLAPKLPIIIPDMVRFEVIRDVAKSGAQEVADWIRETEGEALRVASTEVCEEYLALSAARPGTKTAGRGTQAAAEVLCKVLAQKEQGAVLLFEDSDVREQNFLVRMPAEFLVTSTSEFLFELESLHLLPSAAAILQRATATRANEIRNRGAGGAA